MEFETRFNLEYTEKLRDKWRAEDRRLAWKWYKEYPFFDPADWDSAKNQHDYHFFEWYAAILIYERTGWFSLIEKYDFKGHHRKSRIVELLMDEKQKRAFDRTEGLPQCPDLLVYEPHLSDFYFCEVKGPRDRKRPKQDEFFRRLARNVGKPVYFARFHEV